MTRIISSLLACVLLLVSGASGAETKSKDPNSAKDEKKIGLDKRVAEKLLAANELLAAEKYDAALAIVDELATRRKLGPAEQAQIHRFRGYIFVNQGKTELAAGEFQQSLA